MINGIVINKLITHDDERGFFREVFRFQSQFEGIPIGQISNSLVKPGVIKAWHSHIYQHQWNYVVTGKIKVVLVDNRKDSSTYMQKVEFIAGEERNPVSYYFSPGILHGYKCLEGPMQIIYVTSGIYDLSDEVRIEQNTLTHIFNWNNEGSE